MRPPTQPGNAGSRVNAHRTPRGHQGPAIDTSPLSAKSRSTSPVTIARAPLAEEVGAEVPNYSLAAFRWIELLAAFDHRGVDHQTELSALDREIDPWLPEEVVVLPFHPRAEGVPVDDDVVT